LQFGLCAGIWLAAAFPFFGRQTFALERQASSLLRSEADPRLSGRDRKHLLEHPDFLLQALDPANHPLVDRVHDHRDDELDGHREHWFAARMPALGYLLLSAFLSEIERQSGAMSVWTARGTKSDSAVPVEV